jgi:hypothetical protein
MPENTIYQLTGNIESEIRQSYTGGAGMYTSLIIESAVTLMM